MDITDPEGARLRLRTIYTREFGVCDLLAEQIISATSLLSGRNDTPERILAGILMRSLKTWLAVIHMCEGGYGPQAAMLNRVLFEDVADAAWTSAHPLEAAERYAKHERFDPLLAAETSARSRRSV